MKKICPLPWLSLSTESQRELRLCCHEAGKVRSKSYLENYSTALDAFNLPYFQEARKQMMTGDLPDACIGCKKLEEQTGHSPRLEYLERFKEDLSALIDKTKDDGTLEEAKLVYLDVTTDNQCNLKCRMCRPRYSQKILDDWQSFGWDPGKEEVEGIDIDLSKQTYRSSTLIKESLPHLKMVTLTGGEPFLSPAVDELLDVLKESGHASNISLRFFTNTTVFPKSLKETLNQFKEVHLFCSIDGYGGTSDYIRYPSKWSTIERVYRELIALKKDHPNLFVDLHTVVQANNVTQLIDLFRFLATFKGEVPLMPSFTHVDSSLPLSVYYVPANLLKKALTEFDNFLEENALLIHSKHQAFHEREIENYRSLLKDAIDTNRPEKFIDFVIYSKKMDRVRGQSLEKQYPEFKLEKKS